MSRKNSIAGILAVGFVIAVVGSVLTWSRAFVPYVPVVFDSKGLAGFQEAPEWNTDAHQRVIQQVLTINGVTWELYEGRVCIRRWQSRDQELIWNFTTRARELEGK